MRALTLLLATLCQRISAFFGRLGIKIENYYYTLTEMRRA